MGQNENLQQQKGFWRTEQLQDWVEEVRISQQAFTTGNNEQLPIALNVGVEEKPDDGRN